MILANYSVPRVQSHGYAGNLSGRLWCREIRGKGAPSSQFRRCFSFLLLSYVEKYDFYSSSLCDDDNNPTVMSVSIRSELESYYEYLLLF